MRYNVKILLVMSILILSVLPQTGSYAEDKTETVMKKIEKNDAEWKKALNDEQFHVLREKGTERAFTGKYWQNHAKGIYRCAGCGAELFSSDTKFDSGTGWPSFWAPMNEKSIAYQNDTSFFTERTEVYCPFCGGHLGHVFDDGPKPTGKRYCINSAALNFENKEK